MKQLFLFCLILLLHRSDAQLPPINSKSQLVAFLNQQPGLNYKLNDISMAIQPTAINQFDPALIRQLNAKAYPFKLVLDLNRDGKKDVVLNYCANNFPVTTAFLSTPNKNSYKAYSLKYTCDYDLPYVIAPFNDSVIRVGRVDAQQKGKPAPPGKLSSYIIWDTLSFTHGDFQNFNVRQQSQQIDSIQWRTDGTFRSNHPEDPYWMTLRSNGTATWHHHSLERLPGSRIWYNLLLTAAVNADSVSAVFDVAHKLNFYTMKKAYLPLNNRWRDGAKDYFIFYFQDGRTVTVNQQLNSWPHSLQFLFKYFLAWMNEAHPMWQILQKEPLSQTPQPTR